MKESAGKCECHSNFLQFIRSGILGLGKGKGKSKVRVQIKEEVNEKVSE